MGLWKPALWRTSLEHVIWYGNIFFHFCTWHDVNIFRACLFEGGVPQVGKVTRSGLPHLTCKRDQVKMRDYMDTPPNWVTSSGGSRPSDKGGGGGGGGAQKYFFRSFGPHFGLKIRGAGPLPWICLSSGGSRPSDKEWAVIQT